MHALGVACPTDALASFTEPVRDWFSRSFERPIEAQLQAWPAIAGGEHVLVSAPTRSGKTLAAFLWGLDRLAANPLPEGERRTRLVEARAQARCSLCRQVYISDVIEHSLGARGAGEAGLSFYTLSVARRCRSF